MRSWYPIPVTALDMPALLGEHRELHAMFSVIINNKEGYSNHPETKRWRKHLPAMAARHDSLVEEINKRKRGAITPHKTPMTYPGLIIWPPLIEPLTDMQNRLEAKIKKRGVMSPWKV